MFLLAMRMMVLTDKPHEEIQKHALAERHHDKVKCLSIVQRICIASQTVSQQCSFKMPVLMSAASHSSSSCGHALYHPHGVAVFCRGSLSKPVLCVARGWRRSLGLKRVDLVSNAHKVGAEFLNRIGGCAGLYCLRVVRDKKSLFRLYNDHAFSSL